MMTQVLRKGAKERCLTHLKTFPYVWRERTHRAGVYDEGCTR